MFFFSRGRRIVTAGRQSTGRRKSRRMSECKFCESLQNHKQIHGFLSKRDKPGEGLLHEYTVALVIHSYRKGHKAQAGRSTDY